MMHRHAPIALVLAALLTSCSKQEPPPATTPQPAASAPTPSSREDSANVTHAKLNAGGVKASYAAHFDSDKLARIEEERHAPDGATFNGEYTYQGARLLRYRGARVAAPGTLDLQFDLQGALQSGQGPDVTNEDIAAIRNRAQLLRSHALAQRSSQGHGNY